MLQKQTSALLDKAKSRGREETDDCIIHWDQTQRRSRAGQKCVHTRVTCKHCSKARWKMTGKLVYETDHKLFRGICTDCYNRHGARRSELAMQSMLRAKPAIEERENAFVHWHTTRREYGKTIMKVVCKQCGLERWVQRQSIRRIDSGKLGVTGLCPDCSGKKFRGANHKNWKGGRRVNSRGYVEVYVGFDSPYASMASPTRYVLEHRLVMAKHLGRPLRSYEHVHHCNRKKKDNRLTNLEVVNNVVHCLITRLESRVKNLETLLRKHAIPVPR